jgi:flagella basal body P-ring formation protein FlgA
MVRITILALLLTLPAAPALLARPAAAQAMLGATTPDPARRAPLPAVWVATHTLVAGDVLQDDDVQARVPARAAPWAVPADRVVTGQEMRRRVAVGTPLNEHDYGPRPAVRANAAVRMLWQATGISLEITGRALEAGAPGEQIRVLNTATSRTVRGIVQPDGSVLAQGIDP